MRRKIVCELTGLLTEITSKAGAIDPLDTSVVATDIDQHMPYSQFDKLSLQFPTLDKFTLCNNDTSALMATDQRKLRWHRPVTVERMQISVADTGVSTVARKNGQPLLQTSLGRWSNPT